ncbi:MAG: hypothetical protein OXG64_04250 [Chloroflexi bacterium]|nr:hypothetical protein [Chloroflexota bacterium]MCY3957746.1 hypothetical protein [Chloroflexota bacterium]
MSWERLLALEGGTVGSIACARDRVGTAFAATLTGVFRSRDRGARWEWIGKGLISPFVQDVAVSPDFERDGVVAAATAVSGLHMSFDGGASWFRQEFWGVRPTVTRVAISPDFGRDEVVVAGTQHEGVYVSRNRGRSWNGFAGGLEDTEISAVAIAPGALDGGAILAATATGILLRSTDVGRTWQRVARDDADPLECCAWVDGTTAIAGTVSGRLLRSTDGGEHWEPSWAADGDTVNGVAVDPGRQVVAVTGAGQLVSSNDDGLSWEVQPLAPEDDISALCVAVSDGCALVGTDRGGIYRQAANGLPVAANAGLTNRPILDLAASAARTEDGTLLLGTLQDGVVVSRDCGATWASSLDDPGLGPVTAVRLSPDFGRRGIAGAIAGGQIVWSVDGARSWVQMSGLTDDSAANVLEFSPGFASDEHVSVGGQDGMLYLSQDRGETWRSVWSGLDGSEFLALAYSPHFRQDHAMVAAAGDEQRLVVIRTSDAGETWTPWVEYDTTLNWASLALLPSFKPDVGPLLLAAQDRIVMPPSSGRGPWPGIRVAEGGVAMRQVTLSPDFERDGLAAAATSDGVYVSTTEGLEWSRLDGPLAGQAVERVRIAVTDTGRRTIFAALGRGEVWSFRA